MDMSKFEKIDGREALKRLVCGENILDDIGSTYFIEEETNQLTYRMSNGETFVSLYNLTEMLPKNWYIPKPFDVRQAMLDRPNEWVAAYKSGMGFWFKIGFDTDSMNAVIEELERDGLPFWQHNRVRPSMLKSCIPIEDVPEEATR